jgi:hypothetical protein
MNERPNHALAANGGIASRFQSARLLAAVAELGSLGACGNVVGQISVIPVAPGGAGKRRLSALPQKSLFSFTPGFSRVFHVGCF